MKPLRGIRVVDLGIITAGASTSALLADLGAEVIKVEGPAYVDPFRRWAGTDDEEGWWDRSPYFRFTNRNKRSLCVDLKSEPGRALLLDLVAISDVVVENFRVGVLDRLGLGFAALAKANPRIVLASISSQGRTGPDADAVSFGSTLEASSGMASLMTDADGAPQVSGQALNYPDQVVSLFAGGLIIAALVDVRKMGRAVHLDVSQREIALFLVGEHVVAAAHAANGNRGATGAAGVHEGIYRSRDGRWVAVTTSGSVDWLRDAEPRAERSLAAWIAARDASAVVLQLRAAGGAAEIVRTVNDMLHVTDSPHPGAAIAIDADARPVKGLPWSIGDEPLEVDIAARALGADNHAVVTGLLKRDEQAYAALVDAGVLADRPRNGGDR